MMTYKTFLKETFGYINYMKIVGTKGECEYIVNPSAQEYKTFYMEGGRRQTKAGGLRGILSGNDVFIWRAGHGLHYEVACGLRDKRINERLPEEGITGDIDGNRGIVGQAVILHFLPGEEPVGVTGVTGMVYCPNGTYLGEDEWSENDIKSHPGLRKIFGDNFSVSW